ncbi:MAG: DUF4440 domain-containing protein [Gemmatimonadetes bacterium]|nr:DUF4440 domain-containing protein [Gemmatimonadota bacterium]
MAVVLSLLVVSGGVIAPRAALAQGDEEAVRAVVEAVFAATERSDFAALDSLYAGDDLTIIEGAGIDRGWASYRDHHLKPELEEFENFVYRPHEIEPHIEGEWAWAIFRYDLQIDLPDRRVDNVGRGTVILEKHAGRWVIRHMQTASRPRR